MIWKVLKFSLNRLYFTLILSLWLFETMTDCYHSLAVIGMKYAHPSEVSFAQQCGMKLFGAGVQTVTCEVD